MKGMVSEYEEREAARFGHHTWDRWQLLTRHDRLMGLAHYRLSHIIALVGSDTSQDHSEKAAAAARNRSK
jgi:hypothetical protein